MTTGATGQLGLALPVQGELSGTWGDTVNNGITQYTNIAIAGTLTLTGDGAVTLANTTGDASASNITSTLAGAGTVTAQFAIVRVTGTLTVAKVVTGPSYSKTYTVVNAATGGIVTFKASGQTGVSVAVGESALVYFNGTDYVKVAGTAAVSSFSAGTTGFTPSTSTTGAVTLAGTLATTNGGTGLTSFTANGVVYASSTSALATGSALTFDTARLSFIKASNSRAWSPDADDLLAIENSTSANFDMRASTTGGSYVMFSDTDARARGYVAYLHSSDSMPFAVGGSEQMRLTSTGLGIGTSSPVGKIHVVASSAGATSLLERSTASTAVPVFASRSLATSSGDMADGFGPTHAFSIQDTAAVINSIGEIGAVREGADNSGTLIFRTYSAGTATTQMRIDSAGNLGLGVTPSAWNSGYKALEVKSSGGLAADGTADVLLLQNLYLNSSGQWIRRNAQAGGVYNISGAAHVWYQTGSSTAGSVATLTQAMTLDASGNLGVGTASPSAKLHTAVDGAGESDIARFSRTNGADLHFLDIGVNPDTNFVIFDSSGSAAGGYTFRRGGTDAMTLDASGNLAVGATSAPSRLYVESSSPPNMVIRNPAGASYTSLRLYNDANSSGRALEIDYFGSSAGGGERAEIFVTGAYPLLFGTSNAERARITSGGNFGIGTSSPAQKLDVSSGDSVTRIAVTNTANAANGSGLQFLVLNGGTEASNVTIRADNADNTQFFNKGGERARINANGDFCIGKTSASETYSTGNGYGFAAATTDPFFSIVNVNASGGNACIYLNRRNVSSTSGLMVFISNDGSSQTTVGVITHNGTNTTYGTSSDYRLKNTIAPITGALAKVALLKPCTYKWNSTGADGQGFIAHELAEVCPDAVQGEKDAVDEDGNIKPQGIDTSYLVATLTAAIQELKSELDSVKTELAALKGN